MKMKKILTFIAFFAVTSMTFAQIEVGVRGGLTLASGYTDLPAASRPSGDLTLSIPIVSNKGNGMGAGFLAGIYARKELNASGLFMQADLSYATFTLKQKATDVTLDYNTPLNVPVAALPFPIGLPVETLALDVNGNVMLPTTESESVLQGVSINVLIGKQIADNKFRFYAGPNVLFVGKAEQTITYSGASASLGTFTINGLTPESLVASGALTAEQLAGAVQVIGGGLTDGIVAEFAEPVVQDLTEETPAPNRKVKSTIISLDLGVGTTIPNTGLGIDLRYSVPVFTGVYENGDIDGFLGITSLTVSYAVLKPKKAEAPKE